MAQVAVVAAWRALKSRLDRVATWGARKENGRFMRRETASTAHLSWWSLHARGYVMVMDAEINFTEKTMVQILATEVKSSKTYWYDKCQCASVFASYVVRTSKILNTLEFSCSLRLERQQYYGQQNTTGTLTAYITVLPTVVLLPFSAPVPFLFPSSPLILP